MCSSWRRDQSFSLASPKRMGRLTTRKISLLVKRFLRFLMHVLFLVCIHLAEFWMVEPELAFVEVEDDMNCAEAYVKFLCQWLLDNCLYDMEFICRQFDKTCIDCLRMVASTPFIRITYTEAVELLIDAVKGGKEFDNHVVWGIDLASEHERFLTEVKFQKHVIVYNYPKGIKAFYMRLNDDSKTVAAMNALVPKVGELIGGSQREERYDVIHSRHLTWNKNYSVKPREISEARDRFTNLLQRLYINQPKDRVVVRLLMAHVGRRVREMLVRKFAMKYL